MFETQALLCTDLNAASLQIIEWFAQRWQPETTFQEVRTHLGVEIQRRGVIGPSRTTPLLLALFSLVTLFVHNLGSSQETNHNEAQVPVIPTRTAAWYHKRAPTFSDTIAFLRRTLWQSRILSEPNNCVLAENGNMKLKNPEIWNTLTNAHAYQP